MIKLLKALVLVALAPCLAWGADGWPSLDEPAPKVGGGERDVALVVSIEDYAKLPDIAGAEANGRAWVRWFEGTRGLRPDKVVWLKDSEGTPSEMLAKAGELSALADPKGMSGSCSSDTARRPRTSRRACWSGGARSNRRVSSIARACVSRSFSRRSAMDSEAPSRSSRTRASTAAVGTARRSLQVCSRCCWSTGRSPW